jgi:hypothetical protein
VDIGYFGTFLPNRRGIARGRMYWLASDDQSESSRWDGSTAVPMVAMDGDLLESRLDRSEAAERELCGVRLNLTFTRVD